MTAYQDDSPDFDVRDSPGGRRPYRPPIGIPEAVPVGPRWRGAAASVALHALILFLLLLPVFASDTVQDAIARGAGGPGEAGGGGGGSGGTGGFLRERTTPERLQYIQVAPPEPAPPPAPTPPAVAPPVTPPVTPPPKSEPEPRPTLPAEPEPEMDAAADAVPASAEVAAAPGTGGGTGTDGSAGTGPGSGGGTGSGVGTGTGSSTGPGTGGGEGTIYPPSPTQFFLPPQPVPDKVKGFRMIAVFDVDSTGKVLSSEFTPTRDGGYNKKLKETLAAIRFKPAVRGDGVPVRARGQVEFIF